MLETPGYNLHLLVKKIGRESATTAKEEGQASSLLPFVREFQLCNIRRTLLFRCQVFLYLGMTLCLSSLVGALLGYGVVAMGLGFLGLGLSLFSQVWKRYLPESQGIGQSNYQSKESDSTKLDSVFQVAPPRSVVCPAFKSALTIPPVTTLEAEEFFCFAAKCKV